MTSSAQDTLIGVLVDDRYRILDRLARGGMSTVYRALDTRLDREVALKVLYPHLAEDRALVARFEQEAKTAAKLSHPNVVNVYDQGEGHTPTGTVVYLAMEYVSGFTLRTVATRQGALKPDTAMTYLTAMVRGIAAAHQAGLIHRDIKPENVLVCPEDGRIKVADFGLARAATQHTGTGATLMGTVAYISPELVSGKKADQRSDVYATGIVAYELLTGRQPFVGDTAVQVAFQHVNARVPSPANLVPELPELLVDFVLACTEPTPEDRPHDALEMLTMLDAAQQSLDALGHPALSPRQVVQDSAGIVLPTPPTSPPSQQQPTPAHPTRMSPEDDATAVVAPETDATVPATSAPVSAHDDDATQQPQHPSVTTQRWVADSPEVMPPADRTTIYAQATPRPPETTPSAAAPQPSSMATPRQPRLKGRALTPTHRLSQPEPLRGLMISIVIVMLAAVALLVGWMLAGHLFLSTSAGVPALSAQAEVPIRAEMDSTPPETWCKFSTASEGDN
ncbi:MULTISPECIES: protein kinase [Auritidibacter]|uniref:protein kinase domain-containing protein n=1 Tax=Auritidibacter TaxID=1160973 RepID=UPI001F41D8A9|nr:MULTISPECIES: protein kinase [Auritidibacter]WHS27716.1 protein kinase [Auritidibacter ignavus]